MIATRASLRLQNFGSKRAALSLMGAGTERFGRRALFWVVLASAVLTACLRSRLIQVTVTNASPQKLSSIVIDYPQATFGINDLGPGKSFQYKIKPTAAGSLKIQFLDAHGVDHAAAGPLVHSGDEGSISIKLTQEGAASEMSLQR